MKEVVCRYCCPVALKTIFVAGARGIGMHMVPVLLSEMVRPNMPKTSTKTAIIRPSPRGDRDTMHASSAYSIPQIARRTHSSAVPGPTFDGCSCRWIRSASMPASLLNLSIVVRRGVSQRKSTSRGHTGFLIHLRSGVRAFIFLARRIQPFLFFVDREVEFCVLTI